MVCPRKHIPSVRVSNAMKRISRDKWLCSSEVRRIGLALSRRASTYSPHTVFRAAIPMECEYGVGMIRGKPPAFLWEDTYGAVLNVAKKYDKRRRKISHEEVLIKFLEAMEKSNTRGAYEYYG